MNQIPFLGASGRLASGTVMGMDVCSTIIDSVIQSHMPFQPLVQISGVSNVDRNATPILCLFSINVIARQRLERSLNRIHLV
jgi:hypothetical protein